MLLTLSVRGAAFETSLVLSDGLWRLLLRILMPFCGSFWRRACPSLAGCTLSTGTNMPFPTCSRLRRSPVRLAFVGLTGLGTMRLAAFSRSSSLRIIAAGPPFWISRIPNVEPCSVYVCSATSSRTVLCCRGWPPPVFAGTLIPVAGGQPGVWILIIADRLVWGC